MSSGCSVGPVFTMPAGTLQTEWNHQAGKGINNGSAAPEQLSRWWHTLNDPVLSKLVEEATTNNLDIKQAQASLREARARRSIAMADRYPTLKAKVGTTRYRTSEEVGPDNGEESKKSAQFDLNVDPDLFGGKKNAEVAAIANLDASEENIHDVQVALIAETVLTYIDIRSYQAQLENIRQTHVSWQESSALINLSHQEGLVGWADVEQSQINLRENQAQISPILINLDQSKANLAVLLGRSAAILPELEIVRPIPVTSAEVAVGIPAETLRQRPDIRRAEYQMAAATAQVGVAEAARYPALNLSGTVGLEALSMGAIFNSSALMYSLATNVVMTVFDHGRLKQNVEIQNALMEQAVLRYQAAVQSALRDVENALAAYAEEQNRRQSLSNAVQAASNAEKLVGIQFNAGLVNYSAVLESRRARLSLENQLVQSEAAVTSDLARLYKSLGGGWCSAQAATATNSLVSY